MTRGLDDSCLAVRVVRGVGSEGPNSALEATRSVLSLDPALHIDMEEINWSWQHYVPRPQESQDGVDEPLLRGSQRVRPAGWLSDNYLRNLAVAFRTAGLADLDCNRGAPRIRAWLLKASLWFLTVLPTALVFALVVAEILSPQVAAISLLVPLVAAIIGVFAQSRAADFAAAIRGVILLLLWPTTWILLLPFSSGMWYAAFSGGLLFGASFLDRIGFPSSWLLTETVPGSFVYSSSIREVVLLPIETIAVFLCLAIYRLIYVACRSRLEPLLKIVADVVLYLGDPRYRRAIIADAQRSIHEASARGATRLVIMAHSLGSVICVDALRTLPALSLEKIFLVTAGSPLERLFHRFFPQSYPSAGELLRTIQSVHPNFEWVNVYRLRDPIGGPLLLPGERDVLTPQNGIGWLRAHLNYWSDPVVHQSAMNRIKAFGAQQASIDENPQQRVTSPLDGEQRRTPWNFTAFYVLCAAVSVLISAKWLSAPVREIYDARAAMASAPMLTHVPGRVYWYGDEERIGERGMVPFEVRRLLVAFSTLEGQVRREYLTQVRCETAQILRSIGEHPAQAAPVPGNGRLARTMNVTVEYVPSHPSLYLIRECKRATIPNTVIVVGWVFVVYSWLGASLIICYTAANQFGPFIAGWVGLRDQEWALIRARFSQILNSLPILREGVLAVWTFLAIFYVAIVGP